MRSKLMLVLASLIIGVTSYGATFQNQFHQNIILDGTFLKYEDSLELVHGDSIYIRDIDKYKGVEGDRVNPTEVIEYLNGDIKEKDITVVYIGRQPAKKQRLTRTAYVASFRSELDMLIAGL